MLSEDKEVVMPDNKPGTFMWNELVTTDPAASTAFFANVVGWSAEDMPMPGQEGEVYTIWKAGDAQAGGMFKMQGPHFEGVPPHWMAYIRVANVDDAAAKVEPAGGKVVVPPTDIPGIGRFCVVTDPAGAAVSLMTPAESG